MSRDRDVSAAYEKLLHGRMGRREFLTVATQLGLSTAAAANLASCATQGAGPTAARRPNIILILVDDMGFSDLGFTGSEIRTPNIDSIAKRGAALTSMYNAARCCPTRSALLTGMYPHKAGIGHMGSNLGTPAYQGYLRDDTATIAEALRPAGYRTLMAGKWHVGGDLWATRVSTWTLGAKGFPTPLQRGFDHYYGMIDGVTHYFSPWFIMQDDHKVEVSPTDFYFTDAITDQAIRMIEDSVRDQKPFFLYLAHAAPHWPLHAPEETIARYDGTYKQGWESLRGARHEEMRARKILQHDWSLSPRDPDVAAWKDTPAKDWEARRMAVYAAQIDRLDQQIGRVFDALRRLGQFDDTLVLFFSDNGGCAEPMRADGWGKFYPSVTNDGRKINIGNRSDLLPGGPETFMSYEQSWANVSNTPFRFFKHFVHEGGISTPLLAQWPARWRSQGVLHSPCHVTDLLPTILEAAGAHYPAELGGHGLQRPDGESLMPLLSGKPWTRQQPLFWEHEGNAAVRAGNLKLVRQFDRPWELYDMERDRTELDNLAGRNARLVRDLESRYQHWADSVGVIDWKIQQPKLLKAWEMDNPRG
jgi:arylsulfatase